MVWRSTDELERFCRVSRQAMPPGATRCAQDVENKLPCEVGYRTPEHPAAPR